MVGFSPIGTPIHTQVNSPVPNRHKFQGHEDLGDFGLRMTGMGARCYNQSIGRFMAHDPLSSAAPDWSGYRFGWNRPNSVTDSTGMAEDESDGFYYSDGYSENDIRAATGAVSFTGIYHNLIQQGGPPASLTKAYGKALEALADARAEAIIGNFEPNQNEYGPFTLNEEVEGFEYDERILGNNEHTYSDVTLTIGGLKIKVDKIIFLAGPKGHNIVTGSNEPVDNLSGTFSEIKGPVYEIKGLTAQKEIKLATGHIIHSDGTGRIRKGFIVATGTNYQNLESAIYSRTERSVLNHLSRNYKD